MATAKQAHNRRTDTMPARASKTQASHKKNLRELYTRLEKTQPGSEESKRISAQIADAIGWSHGGCTRQAAERSPLPPCFLDNYEVHTAGSSEHREYWIPAADLHRFNENIVGKVEVISEFRRG